MSITPKLISHELAKWLEDNINELSPISKYLDEETRGRYETNIEMLDLLRMSSTMEVHVYITNKKRVLDEHFEFLSQYGKGARTAYISILTYIAALLIRGHFTSIDDMQKAARYSANSIRSIRQEKGLSLKELGERCDPPMDQGYLSKVETGKVGIGPEVMPRLAKALGVSQEFLEGLVKENGKTVRKGG